MIITCEACSKRYVITPDSLGTTGRTVKCSSCSHTWHQNPPEDMPKLLDTDVSFAPPYDLSSPSDSLPFSSFSQDTIASGLEKQSSFIDTPKELKSYRSSRKSFTSIKAFLFASLLSALCAFLYFGRFYIVHRWPLAEKIYTMIGLQINPLAQRLILKELSWTSNKDPSGTPLFTLKGHIQNISNTAENIPPLTIVFVKEDPQGGVCLNEPCIIDRWIAHTSTDKILPGEIYPFQITLSKSIPPQAANLYVEFVKP